MKCLDCLKLPTALCTECRITPKGDDCAECKKLADLRVQRNIELYCFSHLTAICTKCALKLHKGCEIVDTSDLIQISLQKISQITQKITRNSENPISAIFPAKITKAELENYTKTMENDLKLTKEKKVKIREIIATKLRSEYAKLYEKYYNLTNQINISNTVIQLFEQEKLSILKHLDDIKNELNTKNKDEFILDVITKYKYLESLDGPDAAWENKFVEKLRSDYKNFSTDISFNKLIENSMKITGLKNTELKSYKTQTCENTENLLYLFAVNSSEIIKYSFMPKIPTLVKTIKLISYKNDTEFIIKFGTIVLPYENRIFFIGGSENYTDFSNKCHLYSELTGKVHEFSNKMIMPRKDHNAIIVNHKILVCGGWTKSGITNSCEIIKIGSFDNKFSQICSMNYKKTCISLSEIGKKVYAIGGLSNDSKNSFIEFIDFSREPLSWQNIDILNDSDLFCKKSPICGSFIISTKNEENQIIILGQENYEAYKFDINSNCFSKIDMLKSIKALSNIWDKKPIYTNENVYFPNGLLEIFKFNTVELKFSDNLLLTNQN